MIYDTIQLIIEEWDHNKAVVVAKALQLQEFSFSGAPLPLASAQDASDASAALPMARRQRPGDQYCNLLVVGCL